MNYNWKLSDIKNVKQNGLKVFSCFSCGGGSTMGYKLAGFDVIGNNEIDPKMNEIYKENHNPKFNFLEPIQSFKNRNDIPEELYNLDILDGSPPCSSFSTSGKRHKLWGKEKKFREGQAKQVLDTLFFDFIELAEKLQPKVIIAENVRGIILGKAKKYTVEILESLDAAGYYATYNLLNASKMGVPQSRERVFFSAIRKDLYNGELVEGQPVINFSQDQEVITLGEITNPEDEGKGLSELFQMLWDRRIPSDKTFASINKRVRNKNSCFSNRIAPADKACPTITSKRAGITLYDHPRCLSFNELLKAGSFPKDFNFLKQDPYYVVGMSVPPLMTYEVSKTIKSQWLDKI